MVQKVQSEKKVWVAPTLQAVDVRETLSGPIKSTVEGFLLLPGTSTTIPGPFGPNGRSFIVVPSP